MKRKKLNRGGKLLVNMIVCIFIVLIFSWFFKITWVEGSSMYPTLKNHEIGLAVRNFDAAADRGEVVMVKGEKTKGSFWIKRVIGIPGDDIELVDGQLFVNDKRQNEAYVNHGEVGGIQNPVQNLKIHLDEDQYFLMGDNRAHSTDSRNIGTFSSREIKFKLLYPFINDGE